MEQIILYGGWLFWNDFISKHSSHRGCTARTNNKVDITLVILQLPVLLNR